MPQSTDHLLRAIEQTVPADCWPAAGQPLVIGASGGPDSTALTFLLHELSRRRGEGWRLHLAHLNHGLRREQADADARFVAEMAAEHGWAVSLETVSPSEQAGHEGLGLEEAARQQRYAFYQRILEACGGAVIATAHHADDNVETILHRVIRGTGLRGLSGIPVVRSLQPGSPHRVIRPLLNVRRTEILAYLRQTDLAYCHDHTNELTDFTRNRIRGDLIPRLERDYNPAVSEAVLRLAEQARWMHEYLQAEVDQRFGQVLIASPPPPEGTIKLDTAALLRQPRMLQTELLRRAIAVIGVGEKRLTFGHLLAILELGGRNVSGKRLELPGGLKVEYERKQLYLSSS